MPATYNGMATPENSSQLGIKEFFNDPVLMCLIEQGLANNRDLKILNEEVQIAGSLFLRRQGAYLPFVGFRAVAEVDKPSFFTPLGAAEKDLEYLPGRHFPDPLPNFMLSFSTFWQIDIWRELRNARDAAYQEYLAAQDRRNYFVTRLVADIATNYYGLMALDKRMENLNKIIELQEQSLKIARISWEAGKGTELGVQRFLAEVRKNQSQKLIITQDIIETENRINYLVNRYPQPVERASARFFDQTFPLCVGVPAQLLQNRPDVRQAEHDLVAAGLDVKVARAHFFPAVDITGGIGYEAFNLKYLFWTPDALIYNIGAELVAPVINKRAIQAQYITANAKQLEAVYTYQRVILNAFTEVVNQVNLVQNYGRSVEVKREQLEALEKSVDLADKLFKAARSTYVDVLFAQRDLADARAVVIETRQQQLSGIVNAYQALGGGLLMSSSAPPPPPHPGPAPGQPVPPSGPWIFNLWGNNNHGP